MKTLKEQIKKDIKIILFEKIKNNQELRPIESKDILIQVKFIEGGRDKIRELIRIRDNHTCQICNKVWKKGERRFDIHHISGGAEKTHLYDKNYKNQITLCHKCHSIIDSWKMLLKNRKK